MLTYKKTLRSFAAFMGISMLLIAFVGVNQAAAQASSQKIPVVIPVNIPCADDGAGEVVMMEGTLHVVTFTNTNANGCTTVKMHVQPQKLTGVGTVTGDKYQGTGVTQSIEIQHTDCEEGCIVEGTFVNNFRMIGQGKGNNFTVHTNYSYTYNYCTNEMKIIRINETIDCK